MIDIFSDTKIYWACAIFGSIVFLVQLLMTFVGLDGHNDLSDAHSFSDAGHADIAVSDFKFVSLRTAIAFVTFFGWGGILFAKHGALISFSAALACGLLMMFVTALLLFYMYRLQQSGNIQQNEYINLKGVAYLAIPADRKNGGIVTVSIKNCTRQLHVVSDSAISTGSSVRITEIVDGDRFLVEKI